MDLINLLLIIYLRVNVCREGPYQFVFQYGYELQAQAKRFFEILVENISQRTFTATFASFRCENFTFAQPLLRLKGSWPSMSEGGMIVCYFEWSMWLLTYRSQEQ